MNAELTDILSQFRASETEVQARLERLSEAQLAWRPLPHKWSISENIAHLVVTNGRYIQPVATAIAEAEAAGLRSDGPYHYGWITRWMIRTSEPPFRLKLKAIKSFHPPPDVDTTDLLARLVASHDAHAELMALADGLDLVATKVASPLSSLLRFNLGGLWRLLAAHNRRHIWIADQWQSLPDFPKA